MDDAFGVPKNYFGRPFAEFYQLLGRIVAVSALLELQVLNLHIALTQVPETKSAGSPVGALLSEIKKYLDNVGADDGFLTSAAKAQLLVHVGDVSELTKRRNAYVHGLFPDATEDRVFGWRPAPRGARDSAHTTAATIETTSDEMKIYLHDLVAAVERTQSVVPTLWRLPI